METETSTITEAETSSAPAHTIRTDELISTVDFAKPVETASVEPEKTVADTDPEGANKTGDSTGEQKAGDKEGAETKPSVADESNTRFDKHPRFVELNTRLKAAEEQNRQMLQKLSQLETVKQQEASTTPPTELPYKDWSKMSTEDLLDWQDTDPKGFLDNINKFVSHSIESGITSYQQQLAQQAQQQTAEQKVVSTYEQYAKENPDFDEMWDSGKIKAFIDKHPGHNAISAHQAMTAERRIEAAVAEALKKHETAIKSKRAASTVLGTGPASVPTASKQADNDLREPKKFGGPTAVLAARLAKLRQASA